MGKVLYFVKLWLMKTTGNDENESMKPTGKTGDHRKPIVLNPPRNLLRAGI